MALTEKDWEYLRRLRSRSYVFSLGMGIFAVACFLTAGSFYWWMSSRQLREQKLPPLGEVTWPALLRTYSRSDVKAYVSARGDQLFAYVIWAGGVLGLLRMVLDHRDWRRNLRILDELERLTRLVEEKGEGQ